MDIKRPMNAEDILPPKGETERTWEFDKDHKLEVVIVGDNYYLLYFRRLESSQKFVQTRFQHYTSLPQIKAEVMMLHTQPLDLFFRLPAQDHT